MNKTMHLHGNIIITLLISGTLSANTIEATAQQSGPTKAEMKLYGKTKDNPSVKACNKFLKSYPASVYGNEITELRDSLVFYMETDRNDAVSVEDFLQRNPKSSYTDAAVQLLEILDTPVIAEAEAVGVAEQMVKNLETESSEIIPYKYKNREYIAVIQVQSADLAFGSVRISTLERKSGGWEIIAVNETDKYISSETMNRSVPAEKAQAIRVHGKKMLLFSYINHTAGDPRNIEYVTNVASIDGNEICSAMFYGVNLSKEIPQKGMSFSIEGRSPETMAQGGLSWEQAYLMERISGNPQLKKINEADAMTDDAIAWWLSKNPKAMTSAQTLSFGNLPEECSLVASFRKARKENSKSFQAAVIDLRGYTVVVSYSKSTGKYSLVWAENECKNKKKDRYLADIYFESNGNTLDLFYYKGKTTFKYRISLLAKTIRR